MGVKNRIVHGAIQDPRLSYTAVENTSRTSMENSSDVSFGIYLAPTTHELINSRVAGALLFSNEKESLFTDL